MAIDLPMRRPRTLSLMPTYRCTAACKSCGTLSSPRARDRLSLQQVLSAITEAHHEGIELVVFTGGEATLEPELLFGGLSRAVELRMATRLVTNAHWASSERDAEEYIGKLTTAGLGEINFSTGDQHARFVPVSNVLRAVRWSLNAGLTPAVMIETTASRTVTREKLEHDAYQAETRKRYPGRIIRFNESPWMPLNPRKQEHYPDGLAVDSSNISRVRGCDSVLQTVTVQADGNIGACCGLGMRLVPELNIGQLDETPLAKAIDSAEQDLLKRWIKLEGPERVLAWAATKDSNIEWEGRYAHRCQACLRLYKDPAVREVIREHYTEKIPDILFGEYLLYDYRLHEPPADGSIKQTPDQAS
ncbi:radical SAM protein [Amycolatopsis sp. NPDC051716]|uniref:radical SAM protein n=1 Tax=Amycolatopsis sp. NPDC051716 TaxID=3155804 RepID=UPI0034361B37